MAPHLYKRPVSIPRGLQARTYEEAASVGRTLPIDHYAAAEQAAAAARAQQATQGAAGHRRSRQLYGRPAAPQPPPPSPGYGLTPPYYASTPDGSFSRARGAPATTLATPAPSSGASSDPPSRAGRAKYPWQREWRPGSDTLVVRCPGRTIDGLSTVSIASSN